MHIPNAKRKKLEVDYHVIVAYRLYNPATKTITINTNVVMNELEPWD